MAGLHPFARLHGNVLGLSNSCRAPTLQPGHQGYRHCQESQGAGRKQNNQSEASKVPGARTPQPEHRAAACHQVLNRHCCPPWRKQSNAGHVKFAPAGLISSCAMACVRLHDMGTCCPMRTVRTACIQLRHVCFLPQVELSDDGTIAGKILRSDGGAIVVRTLWPGCSTNQLACPPHTTRHGTYTLYAPHQSTLANQ